MSRNDKKITRYFEVATLVNQSQRLVDRLSNYRTTRKNWRKVKRLINLATSRVFRRMILLNEIAYDVEASK